MERRIVRCARARAKSKYFARKIFLISFDKIYYEYSGCILRRTMWHKYRIH
ncbi:hypothetical protein GLE_4615 [Lysobacter enzymogenes]|uniref:Uncharacterized protein n=1 Tax=Lysobacter enzymogenes TaxID=69 RepID=A0A0S2DN38_LYSEN|nr:hypothetical protein GLE_4615 [Lysobacter enzymogenes]